MIAGRVYRCVLYAGVNYLKSIRYIFSQIKYINQIALILKRSMNLFCFLWVENPKTAHKGGT
jgi:hypothetical protein